MQLARESPFHCPRGLGPGEHVARLTLEQERPGHALLKRPAAGEHWEACVRDGRDHKLWLMYWLIS